MNCGEAVSLRVLKLANGRMCKSCDQKRPELMANYARTLDQIPCLLQSKFLSAETIPTQPKVKKTHNYCVNINCPHLTVQESTYNVEDAFKLLGCLCMITGTATDSSFKNEALFDQDGLSFGFFDFDRYGVIRFYYLEDAEEPCNPNNQSKFLTICDHTNIEIRLATIDELLQAKQLLESGEIIVASKRFANEAAITMITANIKRLRFQKTSNTLIMRNVPSEQVALAQMMIASYPGFESSYLKHGLVIAQFDCEKNARIAHETFNGFKITPSCILDIEISV